MKRLFIATSIKLDENYLQLRRQLKARTNYDSIVWIEDALQHITLRFLGKTPDEKIPLVIEMLKKIAAFTPAFSMEMDKLGLFGSRYAPTTIWLGFNRFDPYKKLYEHVEEQLLQLDFEPNHGNFVPHITLGRIKKVDDKKHFWKLIDASKPDFTQVISIDEMILFQSKLTPSGPLYKVIETFSLTK